MNTFVLLAISGYGLLLATSAGLAGVRSSSSSSPSPNALYAVTQSKLTKKEAVKPYALIFGTVFGADLHPAAGIRVKIRRADQKKAKEVFTNSKGEFELRLPPGPADYVVWAAVKNKQAAEKTQVRVHFENEERRDLALHLTE